MTVVSSCQFESHIPVTGLELFVSLVKKAPVYPGPSIYAILILTQQYQHYRHGKLYLYQIK